MRAADSSLGGVKQKTVHKPLWMRQLRAVVRSCEELCHKCDTKPVLIDKVDCFDEPRLLILRNLLKTRRGPEDSGLQARPLFFQWVARGFDFPTGCLPECLGRSESLVYFWFDFNCKTQP
jgi:hypothetical protein